MGGLSQQALASGALPEEKDPVDVAEADGASIGVGRPPFEAFSREGPGL